MRLKDTGLTPKELKDIVGKYMVETYERYDFIAERAEGMYIYDEEGNAYAPAPFPSMVVVYNGEKEVQT